MKWIYKLIILILLHNKIHAQKEFSEVCEPIIKKALEIVNFYSINKKLTKPVISIAGCSAVGKSYFAKKLMKLFIDKGIKIAIVHFDNFIQEIPVENSLLHPNFNHIEAHEIIAKIIYGQENIVKPTWDLSNPQKPVKTKEIVSYNNIDLLIFEGEFTLCDENTYDFLKYSNIKIYMKADIDDIIEWNWNRKRDISEKSKEVFIKKTKNQIENYYNKVKNFSEYADFIVTQDKNHNYILDKKN